MSKPEYDFAVADKQKARAKLRISFLETLKSLKGLKCSIDTVDGGKVRGTFEGSNIHIQNLLVSNLETAMGIIPYTAIRGIDVVTFTFEEVPVQMETDNSANMQKEE